jgi:hypothetical protein
MIQGSGRLTEFCPLRQTFRDPQSEHIQQARLDGHPRVEISLKFWKSKKLSVFRAAPELSNALTHRELGHLHLNDD